MLLEACTRIDISLDHAIHLPRSFPSLYCAVMLTIPYGDKFSRSKIFAVFARTAKIVPSKILHPAGTKIALRERKAILVPCVLACVPS